MAKTRFLFIDGLRGLAAMAVVVFHFQTAILDISDGWFGGLIAHLNAHGFLGVDVFFVISGFVIPYSVYRFQPSLRFLGRFALRRSIRLDPPYWLTIFAELALISVSLKHFGSLVTKGFPETPMVLSHFVYAQDLLGYGNIVDIFWTLCFEVQFYLFFVLSLMISSRLKELLGAWVQQKVVLILGVAIFVYSLLLFFTSVEPTIRGIFLPRWFQFFLGFLAMQCVKTGKVRVDFLLALLAIIACSMLYPSGADNGMVAVFAAVLIVFAGLRGLMGTWLSSRPLQFLGRISYSLYLIHPVIGWRVIKLGGVWLGDEISTMGLLALFVAGLVSSVMSAWVMYIMVEAPSLRVCHTVKLDQSINWPMLRKSVSRAYDSRLS